MQQYGSMVANSLPADTPTPPPHPGVELKGQNSTFSELGHVVYLESQMQQNGTCSKYFARRSRPPTVLRVGSNGQKNMVMFHIKLK